MVQVAKLLLAVGGSLVLAGLLMLAAAKLGLGRLPGDIVWHRNRVTVYVPWVTMLVVSLLLTLILNLLARR